MRILFITSRFPYPPLKGDKIHEGVFDNSKIRSFLPDFVCRKPFREGVREAVSYMRDHPEQKALSPEVEEKWDRVISAWEDREI